MPGLLAPQRERTFRKPTGRPNPPIILITGADKSGKRYEAARGSSSDLVGMTYWIGIGGSQGAADYYGRIEGARYEIVPHDGSYQEILDAIRCAIARPPVNGKPNMLVLDDVTSLWDLLSDEQALVARERAARRVRDSRGRLSLIDEPAVVDHGLWQDAKDRWGEVLWLLRRHSGPTLLIARQEVVTAYENDKPTRYTTRKIKAEKNLSSAVDATVELRALGEAYLTGGRTLHWEIKPGETQPLTDFSIDKLLRYLGFQEAADTRSTNELRPDAYLSELGRSTEAAQPATQAPVAAPQVAPSTPGLTGEQAVAIIGAALKNETDPVAALEDVREEWGRRTLARVSTETSLGVMNADDLLTRSLAIVKAKKTNSNGSGSDSGGSNREKRDAKPGHQSHPSAVTSSPTPVGPHTPTAEEPGQAGARPEEPDAAAPPPPDPDNPPPPTDERPEDTSAAEEPQDRPQQPLPARRMTKAQRDAERAREVLMAEAVIQARVLFVTVGEHLGPKSVAPMAELRNFLQEQRSAVIEVLEKEGQTELADSYRNARVPELRIAEMFAPYLNQGARPT
ncbi:hypothetical protein [Streptomyces subrutilus]|uniref:Uncharacterized protein n=1 Tax=Streptomyces subrutilus TaxID=36818 RepID=A0A1E5NXQ7_9ACTN|nr:hypothetical protein [Streptomyces subrutilus]OEJ21003.1 hypothetical protein BGK67_34470 [Streptomyces subrutilus]